MSDSEASALLYRLPFHSLLTCLGKFSASTEKHLKMPHTLFLDMCMALIGGPHTEEALTPNPTKPVGQGHDLPMSVKLRLTWHLHPWAIRTCAFSQPTEHVDPNPRLLTNTYGSSLLPGWPRNNQLTVRTAFPPKGQGPSHPFEAEGKLNHWKETELLRSSPLWKMYTERSSAPANDPFSAPLPTTKKNCISFISSPCDCPHCSPCFYTLLFPLPAEVYLFRSLPSMWSSLTTNLM